MSKVISVQTSHESNDKVRYFVTLEHEDGTPSRIEVRKEEADRFRAAMQRQNGARLLTETLP